MNETEVVDIRYICKIIFLGLVSINLGNTFGYLWVGILLASCFLTLGILNGTKFKDSKNRPPYKKRFAYGALIPFAFLWLISPSAENGISPYLIFLPGTYLLYLAVLQERSRGNGGYEIFVFFNGMAALLLSLYSAPRIGLIIGLVSFLLGIFAYTRRHTSPYKYLLFTLVIAFLASASYIGYQHYKNQRYRYGAKMAENYFQKNRMMGFDPVAALGSFESNYTSKYNEQIVLRIWDTLSPKYLKAAAYEKYVAGIWKLPKNPEKLIYPQYYLVDYAVFEVKDSSTKNAKRIWVQSNLDNFGFIFAPYGASGFAAKGIDSLNYFKSGMVESPLKNLSDWFYFISDSTPFNSPYDSLDLWVHSKNYALIDSVINTMGLNDSAINSPKNEVEILEKISNYFKNNFEYSLKIDGFKRGVNKEPLEFFWKSKKGFCEYYATLSVLTLRRLNIPARYVTGFANPEKLPGLNYKIFRRKQAHAWVEVFINGNWVIFDPTPAANFDLFFTRTNWFNIKFESLKGHFAYIIHILKDGEWRYIVESFSAEKFIKSTMLYLVAICLLIIIILKKILKIKKSNSKKVKQSPKYLVYKLQLFKAEKALKKFGFTRQKSETVNAFIKRINLELKNKTFTLDHSKRKIQLFNSALNSLIDYENNRWKP